MCFGLCEITKFGETRECCKYKTLGETSLCCGFSFGSILSLPVPLNYDMTISDISIFLKPVLNQEDSRIFTGRQIHPFFSLWKAGKKVQDMADSGSNLSTTKSEEERTTCGPIHVFENTQVC